MSDTAGLELELIDGIWMATLMGRRANALTASLVAALASALDRVEDSDAAALLLRSGLDRYFCVGGDVHLFANASQEVFGNYLRDLRGVLRRLASLRMPTVAVINGMALGGGFELALNCSVRLLGPAATLGMPEIKLGLLPGATGTQRLTSLIGRVRADEIILSGRSLSGLQARDLGLGLAVDQETISNPQPWVRENLTDSRSAFRSIQRCTHAAEHPELDGETIELREMLQLFAHPEARAKVQAFLARRRP